jgi:divalent metal cation (Fe/Co/Zn/Cd) transporter
VTGGKGVVAAVLFANGAIAVLNSGGFVLTGSPSMLSETCHSIPDTGNRVFLLVDIRDSEKQPSRQQPFGKLTVAGATFPSWHVNVAVLLSATGFETYALAKATGNEVFDAIAALLIGLSPMRFALAWQNKRLLLGESLPKDVEADERVRYVFVEPEV